MQRKYVGHLQFNVVFILPTLTSKHIIAMWTAEIRSVRSFSFRT